MHGPNPRTCLQAGTTPAAEAGDTFKLLQDQGITDKRKKQMETEETVRQKDSTKHAS